MSTSGAGRTLMTPLQAVESLRMAVETWGEGPMTMKETADWANRNGPAIDHASRALGGLLAERDRLASELAAMTAERDALKIAASEVIREAGPAILSKGLMTPALKQLLAAIDAPAYPVPCALCVELVAALVEIEQAKEARDMGEIAFAALARAADAGVKP